MEEVRSYWQVTSIAHFCTLFGKPFKLPTFEPEELEQAFILEIPSPPPTNTTDDEQELHLLVKLAIALLKPHFNCKIR